MKDNPFLQSTYISSSSRNRSGPTHEGKSRSYIHRHFGRYNLGEMAVIFGVGSTLAGLLTVLLMLGVLVLPFVPRTAETPLGYAALALWLGTVMWLWIALVVAGRVQRETRTSDRFTFATGFVLRQCCRSGHRRLGYVPTRLADMAHGNRSL
jgi:hypothetical protein